MIIELNSEIKSKKNYIRNYLVIVYSNNSKKKINYDKIENG